MPHLNLFGPDVRRITGGHFMNNMEKITIGRRRPYLPLRHCSYRRSNRPQLRRRRRRRREPHRLKFVIFPHCLFRRQFRKKSSKFSKPFSSISKKLFPVVRKLLFFSCGEIRCWKTREGMKKKAGGKTFSGKSLGTFLNESETVYSGKENHFSLAGKSFSR